MGRKQGQEKVAGQCELFDLSHYDQSDLTGSHNDDIESNAIVKAQGKKSKIDPTWEMSDRDRAAFAESYRPAMVRIFAKYPKATAGVSR